MFRSLMACAIFTVVIIPASLSDAVAQDARSQAVAECRALGHGGRAGGSPGSQREAMRDCVKQKMQQKKKR